MFYIFKAIDWGEGKIVMARDRKIIDSLPKYSDFGKVPSICTHHKPIDWNLEQG